MPTEPEPIKPRRIHDYPSAFPHLTLEHIHTDGCCGIDELGKPSFICGREFNACTTCMAIGASVDDMAECVRFRREKARKEGNDERRQSTVGCF